MALSATFMKAILAMDSYNRSYNQGIIVTGTQLGLASILTDSEVLGTVSPTDPTRKDVNIGFYAIAYDYAGQTTIAYRGTDENIIAFPLNNDVVHGFPVGADNVNVKQALMAFQFFQTVNGGTDSLVDGNVVFTGPSPYLANISVTGHSLGGGLAGLVGAVYGKSGVLLDNMAFEGAAKSTTHAIPGDLYPTSLFMTIDGSPSYKTTNFNGLSAYTITGQILALPFVPGNTTNQDLVPPKPLDLYAAGGINGIDAFDLHNVATLVIRMYADEPSQSSKLDWQASAKYFWPVMYDNNFAKAIGINATTVPGRYTSTAELDPHGADKTMRTLIAYSAIDEGANSITARPFGDTGIKAFYDDANNLGKITTGLADVSWGIRNHAVNISEAFVQFAGELALHKILSSVIPAAVNGVLTLNATTDNHSLTVDFSDVVWKMGMGTLPPMQARTDLVTAILNDGYYFASGATALMGTQWGNDTAAVFEKVVFATNVNLGITVDAPTSADRAILVVGNDNTDIVKMGDGNALILGGLGTNTVDYSLLTHAITMTAGGLVGTKDILMNVQNIAGTAYDDTIYGNNILGTLKGGAGNDIYHVTAGDLVVEASNEGTDTIISDNSINLGQSLVWNVENATLTGTANVGIEGSNTNNVLIGNSGNNVLNGWGGVDYIDGGLGADTMTSNDGNDTFVVDNPGDVVVEYGIQGTSMIVSSVSFTATINISTISLMGTSAINATGNTLDNTLSGNSAANVLTGLTGNDLYFVTAGDTVVEKLNEGTDTVSSGASWTLGANLENLTLTGTAAVNGTGNSLNNVITGNSANNVLNGGVGADTLSGGLGNDTYVIDNIGDVVTEGSGAGTDLVQSNVTYTLGANFENLTLTGTSVINAVGNAFNNILRGNTAINTLTGALGNDTYYVTAGDIVTEALNAGTDTVSSGVTWVLGANIENLTLTGTGAVNGTGNTLNNVITGNGANNILNGGAGVDTLKGGNGNDSFIGGLGADTLTGGAGLDRFMFDIAGLGAIDKITDFSTAQGDVLNIHDILVGYNPVSSAITDFLQITNSGANSIVKADRDGTGTTYGWAQIATLSNIIGLTDEALLFANYNIAA